jgi:hypothetical protein
MSDTTNHGPGCVPTNGRHVSLLSVPKEGRTTVRLLSAAMGILTHWVKRRPLACSGIATCPQALHRCTVTWKGYAAAEQWVDAPHARWYPCVLEITERLWESMMAVQLRGSVWQLERVAGPSGRIEVAGQVVDLVDPRKLRTDVDVRSVVCRVYRTTEIAWGVLPLLPPRQMLEPSLDVAPPTAALPTDPKTIVGTPEWEADQDEVRKQLKALTRRKS